MAHLYVKDIQPGQQIQDTYMVTQPVLRNTTAGRFVYRDVFVGQDRQGQQPHLAGDGGTLPVASERGVCGDPRQERAVPGQYADRCQ